jgi:hypothetical protein
MMIEEIIEEDVEIGGLHDCLVAFETGTLYKMGLVSIIVLILGKIVLY